MPLQAAEDELLHEGRRFPDKKMHVTIRAKAKRIERPVETETTVELPGGFMGIQGDGGAMGTIVLTVSKDFLGGICAIL